MVKSGSNKPNQDQIGAFKPGFKKKKMVQNY